MKTTFPEHVDMQLTYLCNLHCKMCGQWGENGIFRKNAEVLKEREISTEKWLSIIETASEYGTELNLWGGEPLLSKSFLPIAEKISELNMVASIVTNGTLLENFAESIVKSKFRAIYLSLDGDNATHDKIRGQNGAFNKLKKGIEKIIKYRGSNKHPYMEILSVVQKNNENNLEDILKTAAILKVDRVQFAPLMFIDPAIHEKQKLIMHDMLDTDWNCSSGWDLESSKAAPDAVAPFLQSLPKKYHGIEAITTLPASSEIREWQENSACTFGREKCVVPWKKINIMPDGNCNFCMDFPDYIIGNVNDNSLEEIWNGAKAERFRDLMKEKGIFPACSRCIWLYNDFFDRKNKTRI